MFTDMMIHEKPLGGHKRTALCTVTRITLQDPIEATVRLVLLGERCRAWCRQRAWIICQERRQRSRRVQMHGLHCRQDPFLPTAEECTGLCRLPPQDASQPSFRHRADEPQEHVRVNRQPGLLLHWAMKRSEHTESAPKARCCEAIWKGRALKKAVVTQEIVEGT